MNRTKNRRFISIRLKFDKGDIGAFLESIKDEHNWTWKQFADKFRVSEHVIRYEWRRAKTTIPQNVFNKLKQLSKGPVPSVHQKLDVWWGQKIGIKSKYENLTKVPTVNSEKFAEFYGALIGDGCIYSTKSSFCITCNSILDKWYVEEHLKRLCRSLFNITPKIYLAKNENAIRLVVNNVQIARFLIKFGFPPGRKKHFKLEIPKEFFSDNKLLAACLRGMIDTDGGVYPHPHTKIMLDFTSIMPSLLMSVHKAFQKLDLPHGTTTNKVQFYGHEKLAKYFSVVGSSNPRNIIRYVHFLKTGITPSAVETERLLKEQVEKLPVPYHGPVV